MSQADVSQALRMRAGLKPWAWLIAAVGLLAVPLAGRAQGLSPVLQRAEGVPAPSIVPQGSPIPGIRPPQLPSVSPGLPNPPPAAPALARTGPPIDVIDVGFDGATAYTQAQLAREAGNLVGPAVPQARIEAARAAIVSRYRSDGYVYTVVNALINAGHLRFEVIEGHIVSVKLDGDIGPAGTQVLRFLRHLQSDHPLNVLTLERWLLLASDVPGVAVRSVLNPSDTDPGALTLVAQVTRRAFSGLLTADNRAFAQTGPEEILGVFDFNSFTEFGEKTEVSLYHTFNNTNTFGQASIEAFLGGSGLRLRVYGGAGEAVPSGDLRAIGYDGVTRVFGGQLTYPILRQRVQTLNVVGIFDALESDIAETSAGPGGTAGRASFDSLRVFRVGLDYARLDTLLGASRSASDGVSFRVSQGVPSLGATRNNDPQAPRVGEQTDFSKISGDVSRTQTLFDPWPSGSVALKGEFAGQFSNNVLPPAEQFYLGGPHFNRGFYFGQVTGDNAITTTVELQLNTPIPLPAYIPYPLTAQFYGFFDYGETWNNNLDPNRRLRSVGGGVRFYLTQFTEVDLEGVARLTRRPLGDAQVSPLPGSAFYWQVLARF